MCGRASLTLVEKELEQAFNATFYSEDIERYTGLPNYNIAPTHKLPVIKNSDPEHFNILQWGLIPHWAKNEKIGYKMINARIETLLEKSSFKKATEKRRCLIPLDGYYEWKKNNKIKIPYRIIMPDKKAFLVAGIYETWYKGEKPISTFSIITKKAMDDLSHIHDRMPAVLNSDLAKEWISDDVSVSNLLSVVEGYQVEMDFYRVSDEVGNVRNNRKELIEEIKDDFETTENTLF